MMAQWGEERTFTTPRASIRVIPTVDTGNDVFGTINLESTISGVTFIDARGNEDDIELLKEQANAYIARPYAEWTRQYAISRSISSSTLLNNDYARAAVETMRQAVTGPGIVGAGALTMTPRQRFLASQGLPMNCDADQFSDSVVCPCGVKFRIGDPSKCGLIGMPLDYQESVHTAKRRGVAVQPLSPRQVAQAQRRLGGLYSEPQRRLWGIWPVYLFLALTVGWLALAVGWLVYDNWAWLGRLNIVWPLG